MNDIVIVTFFSLIIFSILYAIWATAIYYIDKKRYTNKKTKNVKWGKLALEGLGVTIFFIGSLWVGNFVNLGSKDKK